MNFVSFLLFISIISIVYADYGFEIYNWRRSRDIDSDIFSWRKSRDTLDLDGETQQKKLLNHGLYRIENFKTKLFLTAKTGIKFPGPIFLEKGSSRPSQIWEVTVLDDNKGYLIVPLENEFNSLTSSLREGANTYNVYDFASVDDDTWLIKKSDHSQCITTERNKLKYAKCNELDGHQKWKFLPLS